MSSFNTVIQGDCSKVMATLPDNSIDLICTDPPYFGLKGGGDKGRFEWWDRQWDRPEGFLAWLDSIAEQWQRILKPNGSLYCFASPKMAARVEVKLGDRFNVLNHAVWDKGGRSRAAMTCKEESRAYFPESERIIFCEHYGADNAAKGESGWGAKCDELRGFVFEPLQQYMESERQRAGVTYREINSAIGRPVAGGGMATHYFSHPSKVNCCTWQLPTLEHYTKLQQAFPGYFLREYEDLRAEYEELRRPFNVSADVPYTDVWSFPTVSAYPGKHPCEKPLEMLSHIISASSRPGAVVLDCFAGSGNTLVAAKSLGRQYIGIEIDPHWVAICHQKLGNFSHHAPSVEERLTWLETQVSATQKKIRKLGSANHQLQLFSLEQA